ncbi:MAG: hypothetical protein ACYCSX_03295 [Acidimicrobiales bacterium]
MVGYWLIDDVLAALLVLHDAPHEHRTTELAIDLDIATSLVLFRDGTVLHDFIDRRGPLLPVDEANLAVWSSLGGPTVRRSASCGRSVTSARGIWISPSRVWQRRSGRWSMTAIPTSAPEPSASCARPRRASAETASA